MPSYKPANWPSVVPRIVVDDPAGLCVFLRSVFGATGDYYSGRPAEMRIDDSIILVSDGGGVREKNATFLYIYVEDTDTTYHLAVQAGAESLETPAETPYGHRRAMIRDPWNNIWQIATARSK